MKITFIIDDIKTIMDSVDPATMTLYTINNSLNNFLISNPRLFDKYSRHEMLLSFPYTDEDGLTATFCIDTRHLDNFNRYDLRLIKLFQYLTMLNLPSELEIKVEFYLGKINHHSGNLFSQISRGRTLDRIMDIQPFLQNLKFIYDIEYYHGRFFMSDCQPLYKILLLASLANERMPEIPHPLCDIKIKCFDNLLTGTPIPIPEKCIGKTVDLIDFHHASQLNLHTIFDTIIHLNIKKYVNANLKTLAKILFFPQVPLELKKAICKSFPTVIFHLIRHHIEKSDINFYDYISTDGETLAATPANQCVSEWANQTNKDEFVRIMAPIVADYHEPLVTCLILAALDRTRRDWLMALQPAIKLSTPPSLTEKGPWHPYYYRLFPLHHVTTNNQPFRSVDISTDTNLQDLQDNLLKYVMAGNKTSAKALLQDAKIIFPKNYWHLVLDRGTAFEPHAPRQWLVSPLEFAAWSGDIYTTIMLIESLPLEIATLTHALTQLRNIMHRANGLEHGIFMTPFHLLRHQYSAYRARHEEGHQRPYTQTERRSEFCRIGELQKQLPLYGLQAICHPTAHGKSSSFDCEPNRDCQLVGDFILDTDDLSDGRVLTRNNTTLALPQLESYLENNNVRSAKNFLAMEANINALCIAREKDFKTEINCLENQIRQLIQDQQTNSADILKLSHLSL